jgi:hypothetical protein
MKNSMKLGVYSKSGGMIDKTREKMRVVLDQLMAQRSEVKCEILEDATPMNVIPVKPKKSNVLKLSVDSEVRGGVLVLYRVLYVLMMMVVVTLILMMVMKGIIVGVVVVIMAKGIKG